LFHLFQNTLPSFSNDLLQNAAFHWVHKL
jgi:hypothetical protein